MLQIALCLHSDRTLTQMTKHIKSIVTEKGIDANVDIATSNPNYLLKYIGENTAMRLFLLDVNFGGEAFGLEAAREIRKLDDYSYIAFFAASANLVNAAVCPEIHPISFKVMPLSVAELAELLTSVYADYAISSDNSHFCLTVNDSMFKLPLDDIFFLEAKNKRVYIQLKNKSMSTSLSLTFFEKKLGDAFLRVHRSYIVNKKRISQIDYAGNLITMSNGQYVDISRSYKGIVKAALEVGS